MAKYSCLVYTLIIVGVNADNGISDFSNNLASDLGPLLALFGEAMTRQYLSECTSFVDYFIFAMAPIGIITAMVSVIRVCGSSSLRAFVGRAQEGEGAVEAELCTSTSRDVCELFNRGGIARVLGRPDILELVYRPPNNDQPAELHLFRRYLQDVNQDAAWTKIEPSYSKNLLSKIPFGGSKSDDASGKSPSKDSTHIELAPKPNLSLNVGIKRQPTWVFYLVAISGFVLQVGIMIFAGATVWILHWDNVEDRSEASRNYAPGIYIAGTVALSCGTWGCAALIGQTTNELYYQRKDPSSAERLYWLQPGPQVIGDQSFDPFAFSDGREPLTMWTSSTKDFQHNFQIHTFIAVALTLLGYVAQFIGLRGLNAWVSIAQLCLALIMSVLRGALRMQRLNMSDNSLSEWPDLVAGHELDWLAFEIARQDSQISVLDQTAREKPSEKLLWLVTGQPEDGVEIEQSQETYQPQNVNVSTPQEGKSNNCLLVESRPDSFPEKCSVDYKQLVKNRSRLAHLTGHYLFEGMETGHYQPWKDERVKVRAISKKLAAAICQAAAGLLHGRANKKPIKLVVGTTVPNDKSTESSRLVDVIMKPPADHTQINWTIDSTQLEAILGLWLWSLTLGEYISDEHGRDNGFSLSDKPNVSTMRLISAGNEDDHNTNIDMEMSLWMGSDTVQYPEKILEAQNGHKHNLFDLWKPTTTGSMERVVDRVNSSQSDQVRHEFVRFCGWTVIHGLPQPLLSDQKTRIQAFRINAKESTLLNVCAQDLFVALVCSLAKFKWRNMDKTTLVESDGNIRLENLAIAILTRAFIENGLGTYSQAISCIVPPFRSQIHPDDESFASTLTREADKYRQNEEWGRAEIVLRWACQYFTFPTQNELLSFTGSMTVLRAIGELYRWSLSQIANDERREFGHDGINWMKEIYGDSNAITFRYIDIQQRISVLNTPYNQSKDKKNSDHQSEFVRAMKDRRRADALYYLCFINTGDFASKVTGEALPLAVCNDWTEIADAILEMKGSPNSQDEHGRTAVSHCAELGYCKQLKRFIDLGAHLEFSDKQGRSPLHWAALSGQADTLELLLETEQTDYNRQDHDKRTPLWLAISHGHADIAKQLLDFGADAELRDHENTKPLHLAVKMGHLSIVEDLMDHGALVDPSNENDEATIDCAIRNGDKKIIKKLLSKCANVDFNLWAHAWGGYLELRLKNWMLEPNLEILPLLASLGLNLESRHDDTQKTPLIWAAEQGHDTLVQQLLENGADIDAEDGYGNTALYGASEGGHEAIIQMLLNRGADTTKKCSDSTTPIEAASKYGHKAAVQLLLESGGPIDRALVHAAENGHEAIVQLLLENGADVNTNDQDDTTALRKASENGHKAIVQRLLESGATINNALVYAAKKGNEAIVQLLLENGADINAKNKSKTTALINAAEEGDIAIVQLLLDRGADVNANSQYGTALLGAARRGCEAAVIKLLLDHGADINASWENRTALTYAAREGSAAAIQLLLDHGADVNSGASLVKAIGYEHEFVVQLLLQNGADINGRSQDWGETPLMAASARGLENIVRLLLERGAFVDARSDNSETPLMFAVEGGDEAIIRLLLNQGATINTEDKEGETPLVKAAKREKEDIVWLLLENGAVIDVEDEENEAPLDWATRGEREMEAVRQLIAKHKYSWVTKMGQWD